MAQDIRQTVRRIFQELWSQGRLEVVDALVDRDYQGYIPPLGRLNQAGLKEAVRAFRQAFPDLRFELRDLLVEGNKAVAYWVATGTNRGSFIGLPPSGAAGAVSGFTLLELRGGRVVRDTSEYDQVRLFRLVGVDVPIPAGSEAEPAEAAPGALQH